jgi:ABC-2 type transport system ATP-binding protein
MEVPAATPVAQTLRLIKRFGHVQALAGIDLSVTSGEIVGLLGPNGAGKTTIIRTLLGYLQPTAGSVRLLGGSPRDIVQAVMHEPEVLLLDEPTSGLDPLVQREVHALFRERRDGGAGVLLSSHVLPEVEDLLTAPRIW